MGTSPFTPPAAALGSMRSCAVIPSGRWPTSTAASRRSTKLSRSLASAFRGRANLDPTRRRERRLGRRREHGEIADVAGEFCEAHLLIAHGRKFAAQQVRPCAMLPDGPVEIDDADPRAGLQGRNQVVEKGEGLRDLVVHMD